jgi:ATP-dependent DNA helicase RecQ
VPAYVVFDNRTLEAIARRAPRTIDELWAVPGIGPAKAARYGEAILALVNDHEPPVVEDGPSTG